MHQQKNGINELMQAQKQILINKLESRQNLNQIITLGQNRFFDFFIEFLLIFGLEKFFFRKLLIQLRIFGVFQIFSNRFFQIAFRFC